MRIGIVDILRRSWEITRRSKFLWPFAFIVALTGGGAQGVSLWLESPISRGMVGLSPIHRITDRVTDYAGSHTWFLVMLIALGALVALIALAAAVFSQATLIGGVADSDTGHARDWRSVTYWGNTSFLRYLALAAMYIVLVTALAYPSILYWRLWRGSHQFIVPCFFGLVLGLGYVIVTVFAGILVEIAARLIVLEGAKVFESIREAFEFFKENWREVAACWLTVLVITIGGTVAMAIAVGILSAPLAPLFTYSTNHHNGFLIALSFLLFAVAWAAAAAVAGAFSLMGSSVWTLTFLELEPVARPLRH